MRAGVYALVSEDAKNKKYYVKMKIYEEGSEEYKKALKDYNWLQLEAFTHQYEIIDKNRDVILPLNFDDIELPSELNINMEEETAKKR